MSLPAYPRIQLAKCYFDLREYERAAHALSNVLPAQPRPLTALEQHALFLRLYALFLAGERRKEEEMHEHPDPAESSRVENQQLKDILAELEAYHTKGPLDAFNLYLMGVVLRELGRDDEARARLVESVTLFPLNWSAWKLLALLCPETSIVASLSLPNHWILPFFFAEVLLEYYQHESDQALEQLAILRERFPKSTAVKAATALAYYNLRDFDQAVVELEELREMDPYRLEGMDVLSNVLYVREDRAALAKLAHHAIKLDKFRVQTCNILGNYYSLRGDHVKAVTWFKRALRLCPSFLSAWTLLGHEYVELHNATAAIQAYRRACDINPRDYRAWYGLGQLYEMNSQHHYALFYYQKAADLRPYDARMWCAVATVYKALKETDKAIKCYERAEANNDEEGIALIELAKLYRELGHEEKAAQHYARALAKHDELAASDKTLSAELLEGVQFLAAWHKNNGDFAQAEDLCTRLLEVGGRPGEEAKSLLLEIRGLRAAAAAANTVSPAGSSPAAAILSVAPPSASPTPLSRTDHSRMSS